MEFKGQKVPLDDIIRFSLDNILTSRFRFLNDRNFIIHNYIRPGSSDLVELFERGFATGEFFSNDTSCGVGYAPLSPLEKAVLEAEQFLNSRGYKKDHPETGEDIKIMGLLQDNQYTLTAGIAFIDAHLKNIEDYISKKEIAQNIISAQIRSTLPDADVRVNTGDNYENESIFMTVTGTSAESGDDGEVGRGNRANGLISPYFPMTMEAVCGKNPLTHTGKLYNWIAMEISEEVARMPDVKKCYCYLVSRIGNPVEKPWYAELTIETADGQLSEASSSLMKQIVQDKLASLKSFGKKIATEGILLVK